MAQPHVATAEAFSSAPDTTERTDLIQAADAMLDALDDAETAGAITESVRVALQDAMLSFCKDIAANLTHHNGA